MKTSHWCLLICIFFLGCNNNVTVEEPTFITEDIDLFWDVYDKLNGDFTSTNFRSKYVEKGSKGLQDYSDQKSLPSGLSNILGNSNYRLYYEACRENTLNLSLQNEEMKSSMMQLQEIYPPTTFTNTYFLIGALGAGGRVSRNGLLIAAEMFSKPNNFAIDSLSEWHQNNIRGNEYLASIVVHELIHFQQKHNNSGTLLEQSVLEGMADYISRYLIGDLPFFNQHLHDFGDPIEEEIWNTFSTQMNSPRADTEWLYTGRKTQEGYPPDMGYYVGYKIVEAYSDQYSTTEEAIKAMLELNDYLEIFEQSNYEDKF